MTDEEFQLSVHDYQTFDQRKVLAAAQEFQAKGVDAVAVDFGKLGYGLMLRSAAEFVGAILVSTEPVEISR